MLVGQVMGARATSTVHKTLKLAHMLQCESLSVTLSLVSIRVAAVSCLQAVPAVCKTQTCTMPRSNVYSILIDFGAESGIWQAPSSILRDTKAAHPNLLGNAVPLPDHDHSLRHAAGLQALGGGVSFSIGS